MEELQTTSTVPFVPDDFTTSSNRSVDRTLEYSTATPGFSFVNSETRSAAADKSVVVLTTRLSCGRPFSAFWPALGSWAKAWPPREKYIVSQNKPANGRWMG